MYDRGVEIHFTRGEEEELGDATTAAGKGAREGGGGDQAAKRGQQKRTWGRRCRTLLFVLEKGGMVCLVLLLWFFALVSILLLTGWALASVCNAPKLLEHLLRSSLLQPLRSHFLVLVLSWLRGGGGIGAGLAGVRDAPQSAQSVPHAQVSP